MRRIILCLALVCAFARADAVDFTNARVFVQNTGDDARCAPQPIVARQNPNLINPPTIACKTIQRACDVALGVPMVHVAPAAGFYPENFVCRIAGTDMAHPVFFHIAEQVEPKGAVWMTGKSGAHRPIGEFTGSYVNVGGHGMHFDGGDDDGLYMHGRPEAHAIHQTTYYGTAFTHNAGRAIHMQYSDDAVITSDTIFSNGGVCIHVEDSFRPKIYSNGIFACGGVTRPIPAANLRTGVLIERSPGSLTIPDGRGEYENNKHNREAAIPFMQLIRSPYWTVTGNHATVGFPAFTVDVSPSSDCATDIISNN